MDHQTPSGEVRARLKIPIAKYGRWKHPEYGTVSFSPDDYRDMVKNLQDNALGFKPFLTLGHYDEEPNSTDSHRKRGDLESVVEDGEIIYGIFDSSPDIAAYIKQGEYEYASGEFIRNLLDKGNGQNRGVAISRVALTNAPFVPFGEAKAQVLSTSTQDCRTAFIMQLSQSIPATPDSLSDPPLEPLEEPPIAVDYPIKPKDLEMTKPSVTSETSTIPVEAPQSDETAVIPSTASNTAPAPSTTNLSQSAVAIPPAPPINTTPAPSIDVAEVVNQALAKAQDSWKNELQTVLESNRQREAGWQTEIAALKAELNRQQETTQHFTQGMLQAREEAQQRQLLSMGMRPTAITKYMELQRVLANQSAVVKLSTSAGVTQDVSTSQALTDLVTELLSQGPVSYGQIGMSAPTEPTTSMDNLRDIAKQNRERATKTA